MRKAEWEESNLAEYGTLACTSVGAGKYRKKRKIHSGHIYVSNSGSYRNQRGDK